MLRSSSCPGRCFTWGSSINRNWTCSMVTLNLIIFIRNTAWWLYPMVKLLFPFRYGSIILSILFLRYGCFQLQNSASSIKVVLSSHHVTHVFSSFWFIFLLNHSIKLLFFNTKVIWWDRHNASISKSDFAICDSTILYSITLIVLKTFIKTFKRAEEKIELCSQYFAYLYYKMTEHSVQ